MKINMDAAIFKEQDLYGADINIRRDQGNFISTKTVLAKGNIEPKEVEAWSLLQALKWLSELQFHIFILEIHCKAIMDCLNLNHKGLSDFYYLIQSCNTVLHCYPNSKVSLGRRKANQVVHSLGFIGFTLATKCLSIYLIVFMLLYHKWNAISLFLSKTQKLTREWSLIWNKFQKKIFIPLSRS